MAIFRNALAFGVWIFYFTLFCPRMADSAFVRDVRDQQSTTNQSFRLTLSDKMWTGPSAEMSWVKHPYEVAIGSRIYAQIQLVQPSNDDDLKAHAKECFFSKNSDPTKEPKSKILISGCAALNTVIIYHTTSLPISRYTRMSFEMEKIYFNSQYVFFQCKVVACSLRGGREEEGYETCPNSSSCSERTVDSRYVPMESPYSYVSSGLMRPIMKADDLPENGKATCPPCPTTQESVPSPAEPQQSSPEVVVMNGVTVPVVIGIGIASFVVGLCLMGALWYVHEHTEPKKYMNVKNRRNSNRDSSSFLSAPVPNACTPMARNGMKNGDTVHVGTPGVQ